MSYTYLILGSGRQGTAAAYDLARFGDAARIVMADKDEQAAMRASERVNQLVGRTVAEPQKMDAGDPKGIAALMEGIDAAMSAVPYYFNLEITRLAISTHTHLADLGGNTEIVRQQFALDSQAKSAGISVVPDCGMGPGLVNTIGAYAMELLDEPEEVLIYDAGLPQNPLPPWNYELTFHINGLTNEMDGQAVFLRNGEVTFVDTLSEPEFLEFPTLGCLEADITSGGTSLAPWLLQGKLKRYENKVLRYPGHYEWLRAYKTLGLFSEQPVQVDGQVVVPRQVYHTLLEPKITTSEVRDIAVMRAIGKGNKNGAPAEVTIDIIDTYDEETGFTAMERLTGWHCSIMMIFQACGNVPPGIVPVETAVRASEFMQELERRGISHQVRWTG